MKGAGEKKSAIVSTEPDSKYYFDQQAADRACTFFEKYLSHVEGEWAGQPLTLAAWQRNQIIAPLFGWKRKADGLRRYREAYIQIPKGNGKSILSSGISLYLLLADNEPGAEVYAGASDKDQARVVFGKACRMVEASPALDRQCEVTKDEIRVKSTGSIFKVLSSIAESKDGLSVHGAILDEYHVHKNGDLFAFLARGRRSRRQPLIVVITTAGDDKESACFEKYEEACKVRDGVLIQDWFLPVIYEAKETDDIYSEATVRKANPNYPISPKADYIQQEQDKARQSAVHESDYKRFNLDIWVQKTAEKFIRPDDWLNSDKLHIHRDKLVEELRGQICFGGLDLGLTNDLSSFCLWFPRDDGTATILPYFWVPDFQLAHREPTGKFQNWCRDGAEGSALIKATEGNTADYELMRKDINEICERYQVRAVGFDKQFASQLSQQLLSDGVNMLNFAQYPSTYNEPMRTLLTMVLGGKVRHGNNEVLTWMFSNLEAVTDSSGRIMPKRSSRKFKIDGAVASIMALAVSQGGAGNSAKQKSVYEQRGVLAF